MKACAVLRRGVLVSTATCLVMAALGFSAVGRNVGGDIGGGIFRPKNPETRKHASKPIKPITRPSRRAPASAGLEDRVEELLDKGNDARDAKKYTEAQGAYEEVLKLKPLDARGAY